MRPVFAMLSTVNCGDSAPHSRLAPFRSRSGKWRSTRNAQIPISGHKTSVRVGLPCCPSPIGRAPLVEKHLPAPYRHRATWHVSTQLAGAAQGEKDLLEICVSLRLVLPLEGVECLMK
jgi:hypothetical protein